MVLISLLFHFFFSTTTYIHTCNFLFCLSYSIAVLTNFCTNSQNSFPLCFCPFNPCYFVSCSTYCSSQSTCTCTYAIFLVSITIVIKILCPSVGTLNFFCLFSLQSPTCRIYPFCSFLYDYLHIICCCYTYTMYEYCPSSSSLIIFVLFPRLLF